MFSVEGTTQITFTFGFREAMARMTPSMAPPPAMSYFIFSMPSAGFIEKPPVSKVTGFAGGWACCPSLFSRWLFRLGVSGKQLCFDGFVVLFVRLVFVRFKIGDDG